MDLLNTNNEEIIDIRNGQSGTSLSVITRSDNSELLDVENNEPVDIKNNIDNSEEIIDIRNDNSEKKVYNPVLNIKARNKQLVNFGNEVYVPFEDAEGQGSMATAAEGGFPEFSTPVSDVEYQMQDMLSEQAQGEARFIENLDKRLVLKFQNQVNNDALTYQKLIKDFEESQPSDELIEHLTGQSRLNYDADELPFIFRDPKGSFMGGEETEERISQDTGFRDLGFEERTQEFYTNLVKRVDERLKSPNFVRSGIAEYMLDQNLSLNQIAVLTGVLEFAPFTGGATGTVDIPIHATTSLHEIYKGNLGSAAVNAGFAVVETAAAMASTIPFAKPVIKGGFEGGINALYRMSSKKAHDDMYQIGKATGIFDAKKAAAAKLVADANPELTELMIRQHEQLISASQGRDVIFGKTVTLPDGTQRYVLDPELVRYQGSRTINDPAGATVSDLSPTAQFQRDRMDAWVGTKMRANLNILKNPTLTLQARDQLIKAGKIKGLEDTAEYKRINKEMKDGPDKEEALQELRDAWDETDEVRIMGYEGEQFTTAVLDPDKLNAMVAVTRALQELNPSAFPKLTALKEIKRLAKQSGVSVKKFIKQNKDNQFVEIYNKPEKPLIDQLFELSAKKGFGIDNPDFINTLSTYGLSFDDYVLTVVGSGSTAGRILNKLSQIKRNKTFDADMNVNLEASMLRVGSSFGLSFRQLENIRRGFLVSRLKTTMRNMKSAIIRSPMEGLNNIFQASILKYSEDGVKGAIKTLGGVDGSWKNAFEPLAYMYTDPAGAKLMSKLVLDNPRFIDYYHRLMSNSNEISTMTGGTLPPGIKQLQDLSNTLNIPNRLQDQWIRETFFAGELQRLLKLEWKVDHRELLKKGRMSDFIENSPTVRPQGARSYEQIVHSAMNKALDMSYTKIPSTALFKEMDRMIMKFNLTPLVPFPKFMFNSLELMGDHAGGAAVPIIRRSIERVIKNKGKYTPITIEDSQKIARNITGIAAISAAYHYRAGLMPEGLTGLIPSDYKFLGGSDGKVENTTAIYPLRQYLFLGELLARYQPSKEKPEGIFSMLRLQQAIDPVFKLQRGGREGEGTVDYWYDNPTTLLKEFTVTFTGSQFRTGAAPEVLQGIYDIITRNPEALTNEKAAKAVGLALGNYFATYLAPLTQLTDAAMIAGLRSTEPKLVKERKVPTDFFGAAASGFKEPFIKQGLDYIPKAIFNYTNGLTVADALAEYNNYPKKEYMFEQKPRTAAMVAKDLMLGEREEFPYQEEGEFLMERGMYNYLISLKTTDTTLKNRTSKYFREEFLPNIVEDIKEEEKYYKKVWDGLPEDHIIKQKYTLTGFLRESVIPFIKEEISSKRTLSKEAVEDIGDDDDPYFIQLAKYRSVAKDTRRAAVKDFMVQNNRSPDFENYDDVYDLVNLYIPQTEIEAGSRKMKTF